MPLTHPARVTPAFAPTPLAQARKLYYLVRDGGAAASAGMPHSGRATGGVS
jgi:hypothetical protein